MSETTLSGLFPGLWAAENPTTLMDLVAADFDQLDDRARALRALAMELVHSHERAPVLTAADTVRMLEDHFLKTLPWKWTAVALNARRERMYVKTQSGGMRQLTVNDKYLMPAWKLKKEAPLPEGGAYLLLYGGSPQVLESDKALQVWKDLRTALPVCDIVCWEKSPDGHIAWSVGAGVGMRGNDVLDFPQPETLEKWRQP